MASSAQTGHTPYSLNKYRIQRRGRKLQVSDDQRTLLALPKDVPERTWAEILQKEENDLVCFDIREEIIEEALMIGYERYMEKQNALFQVHCAAQAWLKLIDWQFYRHDPGEQPDAKPLCYIPKREQSWVPDPLPDPSPSDTWGRQRLTVQDDPIDQVLVKVSSVDSLDYPEVEEIPVECRFPGKVVLEVKSEEFDKEYGRTDSGQWDYMETSESESTDVASSGLAAESEVLQKVTDYSQEALMTKLSAMSGLKVTTPVEGSLHGAGDSKVAIDRPEKLRKMSFRKGDKSSKSFSRASFRRSRLLAPLDTDSRSRISIISDCRLRNLRLDTQFEITSEKINTPPNEPVRKRKTPYSRNSGQAAQTADFGCTAS